VDNNLARFYASADLKLRGTVQQPGLLGNVLLEPGGKLYFGDRSYLIEQGVVNFTDESRVDPVFDVFATTRVKDYEIGLRLTDPIPETTFTSDPLPDDHFGVADGQHLGRRQRINPHRQHFSLATAP
jgi:translocation and assembly module TamB